MSVTVDAGIDALAEEVQRQGHDVDIAGALAVAEERPFDAVGPRHHGKLGGGDRGAAIVVRVYRQHDRVAGRHVPREPFDLIGVDVRRATSRPSPAD